MSISYPVAFPSTKSPAGITFRARSAVGVSVSPFTFAEQVFAHQGDLWEAEISAPPMKRADAEVWVGFLLSLNGPEGTFLMGDPVNTSPRGTWGGSPLLNGAHAAGVKTLAFDGFSAGATGKAGDWLQFGTGSSTRLHKLVQDFTADGLGAATLEIWPRLREALLDNAAVVTSSPKGQWRLASAVSQWTLEKAQIYGIGFSAVEAIRVS